MSLLTLLILSGMVAAVAFFLAGYLLRVPKEGNTILLKLNHQREALEGELERLRADQQAAEQIAKEAKEKRATEESACKHEEEKCTTLERELATIQAELERITAKKHTLAERLRIAEDKNRAAFEQEEANIEAFHNQLETIKADYLRREQGREQELEQLRAESAKQKAEYDRQVEECRKQQTRGDAAERAISVLSSRKQQQHQQLEEQKELQWAEQARQITEQARTIDEQARKLDEQARQLAEVREQEQQWAERVRKLSEAREAETEAHEAENEQLSKVLQIADTRKRELQQLETSLQEAAAREQDALRRLVENETAWQAKLAAGELSSKQAITPDEGTRLVEQIKKLQADYETEREQKQNLTLTLRASEETLEHERAEGKSTAEALQKAEMRLKELDRLAQENSELREQQAESVREAKLLANREGVAKDAKVELAAAQAKLVEMQQTLEENRKLRDQVAELSQHQEASGELERLTATHKQVRLDAELIARRLKELMQEQAELAPLKAQAAEAASLADEVAYLRRREKDLEALIYANGYYASREKPAISGELLMQAPVSDLESNLHSLVHTGGPRTAVLADAKGFLIAAAGETGAQEGLAAFAAVAGEMVSRARMLLPLADVDSVRVMDANRMVLTCFLFDSAGEGLGLATLGPGEPKHESTQQAIMGLAAIVAGTLSGGDDDPKSTT